MDNNLRVALFQNGYKTEDRHPDYRTAKGDKIVIDGKCYDVAVWKRTAKGSGKEYLSLSLTESAAPVLEDLPKGDDAPF